MTTAVPKKKLNKADYMFKSRHGETLIKNPGDINGIDFMIKDLHDCTVYILDHTAQVGRHISLHHPLLNLTLHFLLKNYRSWLTSATILPSS